MARKQHSGNAIATTITGSIPASGGGTVTITNASGWPDGSVGKFNVIVDAGLSSEEKIEVDSRTGTTLVFSSGGRGFDGTTATSHSSGAAIWHNITAEEIDAMNAHMNQVSGSHTATQITYTPASTIAATNVQAALTEVATEIDARVTADTANIATNTSGIATNTAAIATINADGWVTPARYAPTLVLSISRAATQSIASNTSDPITFDTETTDTTGMFAASSTTATVQAASAGLVVIEFTAIPGAGVVMQPIIQINGTPQRRHYGGSSLGSASPTIPSVVSATTRVAATDTINGWVTNASGFSVNFTGTLKIWRLSA